MKTTESYKEDSHLLLFAVVWAVFFIPAILNSDWYQSLQSIQQPELTPEEKAACALAKPRCESGDHDNLPMCQNYKLRCK